MPETAPTQTQEKAPDVASVFPSTEFKFIGFFFATDQRCSIRFGIEQEVYALQTTKPNYNAMFSLLLACWLNSHKVSLKYNPFRIDEKDPFDIDEVSAFHNNTEERRS